MPQPWEIGTETYFLSIRNRSHLSFFPSFHCARCVAFYCFENFEKLLRNWGKVEQFSFFSEAFDKRLRRKLIGDGLVKDTKIKSNKWEVLSSLVFWLSRQSSIIWQACLIAWISLFIATTATVHDLLRIDATLMLIGNFRTHGVEWKIS